MKCPNCGHEFIETQEDYPKCEVQGCYNPADFEGWYKVLDFVGIPTGIIQRRAVCSTHRHLLIGKVPNESQDPN